MDLDSGYEVFVVFGNLVMLVGDSVLLSGVELFKLL